MTNQTAGAGSGGSRDDPAAVKAIGKMSEAFEYVERARGSLYNFHQLMGRADLLFGDAADMLQDAGLAADAARVTAEIVGRNVLDGRWTFQIVEEFDDLYYDAVRDALKRLETDHLGGRRHVFESNMKEDRRSHGQPTHARRPKAAHIDVVDTDPEVG